MNLERNLPRIRWLEDDVKRLKEEFGRNRQLEYYFYPIVVEWIKRKRPRNRAFIGRKTGSPQVDVFEATTGGKITGYEVKLPHIGRERTASTFQCTYVVQGIGQALGYLVRGFDCAYLVTLEVGTFTDYLSKLMEKTVPFLGLITIDRNLDFHVIRRAERTRFYDEESRKSVGWNCAMRMREKGPVPPYFRQFHYDFESDLVRNLEYFKKRGAEEEQRRE